MSNRFGLPDSLLDAVKDITKENKEVRQYRAFGLTTESKNAPSKENGGIAHMCASHVQHATYGEGVCVPGEHTIVETAPGEGYVTHYDVNFDGNIVESVPVEDLKIIKEGSHMHSNVKKDKKKMIAGQKMDPVGKADADIDNDGDVDDSDDYLKNRRKAIGKAMGKEKVKLNPTMESMDKAKDAAFDHSSDEPVHLHSKGTSHVFSGNKATGHKDVKGAPRMQDDKVHYIHHDTRTGKSSTFKIPAGKTTAAKVKRHMPAGAHHAAADVAHDHNSMHEETKVDSGLENPHNCATHVYSESWGDGRTVTTMHADPDENGNIAWYDVFFEHGIEKGVPIEELKVVKSESHMHSKRGKK